MPLLRRHNLSRIARSGKTRRYFPSSSTRDQLQQPHQLVTFPAAAPRTYIFEVTFTQVTPMLFLCRASPLLQRTASSTPVRFVAPTIFSFYRTFANTAVRFSIQMETVDTSERLAQLRELMKRNNLDVYSTFILHFFLTVIKHCSYIQSSCPLRR